MTLYGKGLFCWKTEIGHDPGSLACMLATLGLGLTGSGLFGMIYILWIKSDWLHSTIASKRSLNFVLSPLSLKYRNIHLNDTIGIIKEIYYRNGVYLRKNKSILECIFSREAHNANECILTCKMFKHRELRFPINEMFRETHIWS